MAVEAVDTFLGLLLWKFVTKMRANRRQTGMLPKYRQVKSRYLSLAVP
jgi:hypothetical protein